MKKCSRCGRTFSDNEIRCSECGNMLERNVAQTGSNNRRVSSKRSKRCWYCGWKNPEDKAYCGMCGLSQVNLVDSGGPRINIVGFCVGLMLVMCLVAFSLIDIGLEVKESGMTKEAVRDLIQEEYRLILAADEKNINPFLETLISGFEVDVQSVREENGSYCAVCRFINYDAAQALEQINQQTEEQTWADYMDILLQRMKDLPRKETNVEMRVIYDMDQGSYVVQFDMSQLDAAMGGFISFAAQMGG